MATLEKRVHPLYLATTLLLLAALPGCTPQAPLPGPTQVSVVTLEELPPAARFVEIGNIGQAYRLHATLPASIRFPAPREGVTSLLPGTVRLFHFEEQRAVWTEVADSRFDEQTRELIGSNLAPGLYTAFGWSANPVENALQRLNLDAQRGFRLEQVEFADLAQLRQGVLANGEAGPRLVRDFVQTRVITVPSRICWIRAGQNTCPAACIADIATHQDWSQCPASCPLEPGCCNCATVPGRLSTPESVFLNPLRPCVPGVQSPLCPLCPHGLSCPTRQTPGIEVIAPNLAVLDYSVMHRVGLGPLVEDRILRTAWHRAIEEMLGGRFQDPSPQPSR